MSEYHSIDCSCGYRYSTKEHSSNCPKCGKTNHTLYAILAFIVMIVALMVLIGIMFGALAYAIYFFLNYKEYKANTIKWNQLGIIALSTLSLIFFNDLFEYKDFPVMSWITYITNSFAILIVGYHYILFNKGKAGKIQSKKIDYSTNNEKKEKGQEKTVQEESAEKEDELQRKLKETTFSDSKKIRNRIIVIVLSVVILGLILNNKDIFLGYFSNTSETNPNTESPKNIATDKLYNDNILPENVSTIENAEIKNENIKNSKPLGIINDPDGYTNVRADKSSSSVIIYKIKENKRFEILDDNGKWWKIKFDIDEHPYEIIGFIHNSRVELIIKD